jgi:putative two-component system response regulator
MEASANGKTPRILIVDDEPANVQLLERMLRRVTPAELRSTTDSRTVTSLYGEFKPDLVLLDLRMPHMDGFAVLEALRPLIPRDAYLPILVLTADITPESKQRALSGGAKDFLTKPFDPTEILLRITNLLETRALHVELEDRVRARTRELEGAHLETVERLALAVEYREDGTGGHTRRVGQMSALLARTLGLPQADVMLIRQAAPLHDVGKIAIPDRILLKPDRLTPEEWAVMKSHTTAGAKIVSGGHYSLLLTAEAIALSHHERWDGTGYPRGLSGDTIPLPARVVAVADAFDAMTHARPYREAYSEDYSLSELQRCADSHFDPACVQAFVDMINDPAARALLGLPSRDPAAA